MQQVNAGYAAPGGSGPPTSAAQGVDLAYLDESNPDVHIVKCVLVGDNGVGKTR